MGKCLLSRRDLFPTVLTTTLLLLIYAQPIYGNDLRQKLILDESEVNTLRAVFTGLNQRPFPDIDENICYNKYLTGIYCNCSVHKPKLKCDPSVSALKLPSCRNYTTCHVRSISLSGQQLDGVLSAEFGNLRYLEDLDFSSNYIKGSIPKQLGSLQKLKTLILYRNFLNGSIPKELGAMSSLIQMDLGANRLSGNIPNELGNIISLRHLTLTSNLLDGKVTQLKNLVQLKTLALADNAFNGSLDELFYNLTNMENFDVMGNSFSGSLPDYIYRWKRLSRFNLLGNKFEGRLDAISHLTSLDSLMISDFSGEGFSFPDISKLKNLKTLILRNCSIKGEINKHIGTLTTLRNIDLSFNNLTGALPKDIIKLPLDSIYLTRNNFNGAIPEWDEPRRKKMNADFSHNNFSEVSFSYSEDMFSHLNLYACCNPTTLKLNFTWEKSNFTCPTESKNTQLFINCGGDEIRVNDINYEADFLKNGASTINVSKNYKWAYSTTGEFLGSVVGSTKSNYVQKTSCLPIDDSPLYMDARISPMSLKYYGLCLKNDDYTVKLYFNEIVFTKATDYGVNAKRVFDVFIQGIHVLKSFDITKEANGTRKSLVRTFNANVGNNGLEIHFYWGGQGSIYIPPGLYGPLVSAISVTPVQKPPKKPLSVGQIVGIAGSTFFVMVLILAFLQKMGWLGKKLSNSGSMSRVGSFTFQQLKDATNNFHSDNKIGKGGSVYKGVLPNEEVIAVKKFSSNSKEKKEEFLKAVGTVSVLNHENLVKLLGCSTENNQLLLVYEYMENESLSSALFGSGNLNLKSRLNWKTRMKICLGIAKGLAFLHEESYLKIIHRDIKPTNVLLDKDLTAKISDFGLAIHHDEECALVTEKGKTSCYIAPEYASRGDLTYKTDVYSFGVVMLEILSGKASTVDRPSEETFYLLDQAYDLHQKDQLLELMDPDLKKSYKVSEAKRMLDLAMLCTNQSHIVRPKMSKVVSILEGKTEPTSVPIIALDSDDVGVRKASAIAEPSRSTHSGSPSRDGTSNPFSSGTSREENSDTPMPTPLHGISDENSNTAKNKVE